MLLSLVLARYCSHDETMKPRFNAADHELEEPTVVAAAAVNMSVFTI